MEVIKKQILRVMTTGTTTGCTGSCRIIIPDLDAVYNFKILLTSESHDIGFFDAFYITYNPYTPYAPYAPYSPTFSEETLVTALPLGLINLL